MSTEAPKEADEPKGGGQAAGGQAAGGQAAGGQATGPDPLIGRVINDRFRIVSVIARGGMGKVYRAEQSPLGREVALKVLNPSYGGEHDPEFYKRFFLEASTCAKLTHPNTVTIFDYGKTEDDVYFIAMELLKGRTLHRAIRDETRFSSERTMHIARQIFRSLREAHALGVIHRDLKPANIFLVSHGDERDFVKVLDFGLVKDLEQGEDLTRTGLFMGSPKYMAPEQIRGDEVDERCDVYALGVIMYEMLTGKVPFDRPTSINILMAHIHEPPPSMVDVAPDAVIDPRLEQVVLKAMAKNPEDRFSSMDELLFALKQVALESGLAVSRSAELGQSSEHALGDESVGVVSAARLGVEASGAVVSSNGAVGPSSGEAITLSVAGPLVAPTESAAIAAPAGKNKAMIFVIGAFLVASLVGGWLALRGGDASHVTRFSNTSAVDASFTSTPDIALDAASSTETAIRTVAIEDSVELTLESSPPGATVRVGEVEYGPTPTTVRWTGSEAAAGREVTFQFQLDGHRDFTVTRTVLGETLNVSAMLEEAASMRRVVRRPPRRRGTTERRGGASLGIKGYKAEPY